MILYCKCINSVIHFTADNDSGLSPTEVENLFFVSCVPRSNAQKEIPAVVILHKENLNSLELILDFPAVKSCRVKIVFLLLSFSIAILPSCEDLLETNTTN